MAIKQGGRCSASAGGTALLRLQGCAIPAGHSQYMWCTCVCLVRVPGMGVARWRWEHRAPRGCGPLTRGGGTEPSAVHGFGPFLYVASGMVARSTQCTLDQPRTSSNHTGCLPEASAGGKPVRGGRQRHPPCKRKPVVVVQQCERSPGTCIRRQERNRV